MRMNSVYLLFALLCLPFCLTQDDENEQLKLKCEDKALLSGNRLLKNQSDWNRAYNDVASCATLKTDDLSQFCCYMKIKFKNELLDEKFTQKGCIVVTADELVNDDKDIFKNFLEQKETDISSANNVDVKSLSIDCSAKFINIFTLSLLLFLL